ncbi:MAG: hypothetical protein KBA61_16735 [Spirochaetes bacterium]|nr:hypothetical protein [Spirochaetota bacterium]
MLKKILFISVTLIVATVAFRDTGSVQESRTLSITGLVRNPLHLPVSTLANFQHASIRLNEITLPGHFQGVFSYTGVPLKFLLELAGIQRREGFYMKPIDLAIVVRSGDGRQTVLSWGEVFYRNPSEIIVAHTASPVRPMKDCASCHRNDSYRKYQEPLSRGVVLPRLVISCDAYTDRSLENVVSIEVVNLKTAAPVRRGEPVSSPSFSVVSGTKKLAVIDDVTPYGRTVATGKEVGDGRGFHGLIRFSGAPLAEVLEKAGVDKNPHSVFLVTSADNYRSLLSYGEIFLSAAGRNIIVADQIEGKAIEKLGRFVMVTPGDLSADRWVRAVKSIEQVKLETTGSISIVGVGCGDTDLITLKALSRIARADALICTKDLKERYAPYLGGRPVLFDPLTNLENFIQKTNPGLSKDEVKKRVEKNRADSIAKVRAALDEGKRIALLDYGDPTLYGSWTYWLAESFHDRITDIVPGISAFNAGNAMIGKNIAHRGSAIITVPDGIRTNEPMVKAIADHGDTMVIFVGLAELKSLMPVLAKYYRVDTPVDLVYKAGYEYENRRYSTTLGESVKVAEGEREKFLGLIYIGPEIR